MLVVRCGRGHRSAAAAASAKAYTTCYSAASSFPPYCMAMHSPTTAGCWLTARCPADAFGRVKLLESKRCAARAPRRLRVASRSRSPCAPRLAIDRSPCAPRAMANHAGAAPIGIVFNGVRSIISVTCIVANQSLDINESLNWGH
eukprot:COSAG06_NODE_1019_length_11057_cov_5.386293_6_plen_145_part_00